MPRIKKDNQTPEQVFAKNRYTALHDLARQAGFDDDSLAWSEFCLMPFFELVVEKCAQLADQQARTYSDGDAPIGASNAANAIRNFGKILGNESNR